MDARAALIKLLQLAYSGELAAAHAYQGHAVSVRDAGDIGEYETAARHARACGQEALIPDLLQMAAVEWDHEQFFRHKVTSRRLGRLLPLWSQPPPRESIWSSFASSRVG